MPNVELNPIQRTDVAYGIVTTRLRNCVLRTRLASTRTHCNGCRCAAHRMTAITGSSNRLRPALMSWKVTVRICWILGRSRMAAPMAPTCGPRAHAAVASEMQHVFEEICSCKRYQQRMTVPMAPTCRGGYND